MGTEIRTLEDLKKSITTIENRLMKGVVYIESLLFFDKCFSISLNILIYGICVESGNPLEDIQLASSWIDYMKVKIYIYSYIQYTYTISVCTVVERQRCKLHSVPAK